MARSDCPVHDLRVWWHEEPGRPWLSRNPAVLVEHDVGTEGGRGGWDHTDGFPIPMARRMVRSNVVELPSAQLSLLEAS